MMFTNQIITIKSRYDYTSLQGQAYYLCSLMVDIQRSLVERGGAPVQVALLMGHESTFASGDTVLGMAELPRQMGMAI